MIEWIEGDYPVGHIGFLIRRSNPIRHTESAHLAQRPACTNQSHQPRLYGWCGSWNDTSTDGDGLARVVRVTKNGRCQIVSLTNRVEVETYLDSVGFPELADQWIQAHEAAGR